MEITSGDAVLSATASATESGSGSPDVLLVHAGVTDQRSWSHVVDALAGHRCLTYDARGYGRTTYRREDGWSPVVDAVAVLDAYEASSAVVVGSSMGGRTAINLALAHPDRVTALVLIAPAVSGAPDPVYEPVVIALGERAEPAEESGDLDEVNRLEAWLWLDGPLVPEGRVGGAPRELFLEMNGVALAADDPGDDDETVSAWDRLAEIAVPTMVLVGEHDLRHLRENCAYLARTIPDARLVELAGVAHLPQLEGDPTTLAEISAFVSALDYPLR